VTDKPVTHLIYSHSHKDPIGGAGKVVASVGAGGNVVIIAHEETKKLLAVVKDSERPLPTVTFSDRYTLKVIVPAIVCSPWLHS
jgi:glyoxylase-like metal-dependent hydrolase (beta-lactamase superfamily II)